MCHDVFFPLFSILLIQNLITSLFLLSEIVVSVWGCVHMCVCKWLKIQHKGAKKPQKKTVWGRWDKSTGKPVSIRTMDCNMPIWPCDWKTITVVKGVEDYFYFKNSFLHNCIKSIFSSEDNDQLMVFKSLDSVVVISCID